MATEEPTDERPKPLNDREYLRIHRQGALPDDVPRLMATIEALNGGLVKVQEDLKNARAMMLSLEHICILVARRLGGKIAFHASQLKTIKPTSQYSVGFDQQAQALVFTLKEPEEKKIVIAQDVPKLKLIEKQGG